mmetsp:Transcript_25887/g.36302  ORF Transcript_25887/g.36302 Transcript_25887/m.36302 type:complete len:502 (+) Transcript_25887:82-1587(+)
MAEDPKEKPAEAKAEETEKKDEKKESAEPIKEDPKEKASEDTKKEDDKKEDTKEDGGADGDEDDSERIRGGGKATGDKSRDSRRSGPYDNKDEDADTAPDETRGKRVYVGNLSWDVSWQDLKDHMKSTGCEVTRADVMQTPDGRSKGCGIVEFATDDGAKQAVLTLNDTELSGRQIFVREDREDRGTGGFSSGSGQRSGAAGGSRFSAGETAQTRRVYVGNLSWDVAWQDLKDHMRAAGEVVHAEVITEANGRSKGCGVVEFATDDEAQEAVKTLTDTDLKGRMIFVREDRETSSGAAGGFYQGGSSRKGTSVYVWNLAYETSWQDLKDHMRQAGNVDQATILTNSEGRPMGCGVVVYQRPQEAARAIRELQNSELNGRPMYVREDRQQGGGGRGGRGGRGGGRGGREGRGGHGHGGGAPGTQLYVGNLSFDTNWQDLKDFFGEHGDVQRADVMEGPDGRKKGFGIVRYFNKEDAEKAIKQCDGADLQGRNISVRLDHKAN